MPNIERPPFVERAGEEFERLAKQAHEGGSNVEDVIGDVLGNIQELVDDLLSWVSDEVNPSSATWPRTSARRPRSRCSR